MRKPNCKCSVCEKPIYRRPNEIANFNTYCSKDCYRQVAKIKSKTCPVCDSNFTPHHSKQKTCSRSCSNKQRFGVKYTKGRHNNSQQRLNLLRQTFNFKTCMVDGCDYDRTFDIHRLIPGADGGEYEIGNMFAICPNHHAELHRGIISLEKVSDCKLKLK